MWELVHKEGWVLKNWWFQIVVLEKILESPLKCKKIKPVSPKGNQLWKFIGRIDAEAEAPIFGHLLLRVDSLVKTLMLGKIEFRRRRGQQRMKNLSHCRRQWMTEEPVVLQSGVVELDTTWQLNNINNPCIIIGIIWGWVKVKILLPFIQKSREQTSRFW